MDQLSPDPNTELLRSCNWTHRLDSKKNRDLEGFNGILWDKKGGFIGHSKGLGVMNISKK